MKVSGLPLWVSNWRTISFTWVQVSLIPKPPPFFRLRSQCMGAEDWRKTEKAWEHSSHEWMQGGHRGRGADIQIFTC